MNTHTHTHTHSVRGQASERLQTGGAPDPIGVVGTWRPGFPRRPGASGVAGTPSEALKVAGGKGGVPSSGFGRDGPMVKQLWAEPSADSETSCKWG